MWNSWSVSYISSNFEEKKFKLGYLWVVVKEDFGFVLIVGRKGGILKFYVKYRLVLYKLWKWTEYQMPRAPF